MKTFKLLFALAAPVLVVSCKKESSLSQKQTAFQESAATGNGGPSGPHYNLNLIGVDNPKNFDYNSYNQQNTQGQGHRIFVPLDGTAKRLFALTSFFVLSVAWHFAAGCSP